MKEAEAASGFKDENSDRVRPLMVKELDLEDRPREKALKYGFQALNNAELLAIILKSGTPGRPITVIARELMKQNQDRFTFLERMDDKELLAVKGLGPVKVLELRAALEVMRRYSAEKIGDRIQFKSSADIHEYMRYRIGNLPHEEMWALFTDNSNKLISEMRVSEGSSVATIVDVKKILRRALSSSAQGIILCHNHPTGMLKPSGPDRSITLKCRDACGIMELRMLDHLIISTDGYYSFHDNGDF